MIRIVVAEPRTKAVVKMIPNTLEAMSAEVGGPLEIFRFSNLMLPYAIHCYIHEEGKFDPDNRPNVAIPGDVIVGNIVASKAGAVSGEETGLNETEAEFARGFLDHVRGLCDEKCDAKIHPY